MHRLLILLAACGGTVAPATTAPTGGDPEHRARGGDEPHHAPIDPIAVLAPVEDQPVAYLTPGAIQLELGGAGIESPGGSKPIEVAVVDRQGNMVRAAVRLEHARFSLWSDRARLYGVLAHDFTFPAAPGTDPDLGVTLHAGAKVRRLARKAKRTQVRYVGAIEVEGWIPDESLGDAGPGGARQGFMFRHRPVMMLPGSIIRSEPRWGNNQLAVVVAPNSLDNVQDLSGGWMEVAYGDADVAVRGYTSKQQAPGAIHRPKDPEAPPPVITPNAKVASGTCLYSKRGGDPIGYIVGDRDVQLDDAGAGWWTLAVDTPWGPIPFAAKGATQQALAACAPAGSVPPPAAPAP